MTRGSLLDESMAKIYYTLKWIGISLEKKEGRQRYPVLYFFNFIWLNTDVAGAFAWFIRDAQKGESLTSLTMVAPCITLCVLANVKSLCFIVYSDHADNMMTSLRALEVAEMNRPKNAEKEAIINRETSFLHTILNINNFFNWLLIVSFPSMALIMTVVNYVSTQELNLLLPFLILYPFDPSDPRIWPFMFARQIWSVIIVIFEICSGDFVFFICSTSIRVQFQLHAYELERIVSDTSERASEFDSGEFTAKFRDVVKWHQELIKAVELLEVIYTKSTLFNFVSSSALICLTGFNVMAIEDVTFVVSFLTFLSMSLIQIYFLCLFGDMLMRTSVAVGDAVYNSKWYYADVKSAKMLLVMQTRAQKACRITALGFADVNLRSFTRILSTAWSYFALLKTLYSSPRG